MADKLIVKGLERYDGEYEFDLMALTTTGHPESLTNKELHRLKLMSGVRLGELDEALFDAYDNDVIVAIAAIILTRYGKQVDEEALWDAPVLSGIRLELGKREDVALPPAEAEEPPSSDDSASNSESLTSSGVDSAAGSVSLASVPNPTGMPASDTSATSGPETLAS